MNIQQLTDEFMDKLIIMNENGYKISNYYESLDKETKK